MGSLASFAFPISRPVLQLKFNTTKTKKNKARKKKVKCQFEKENVDQTVKLICSCHKNGITL